jgi:2'-5' RNA ligase
VVDPREVNERPRLFVAVELPVDVRAAIERAIEPLHHRWARLRWVPPERWHLTLRFLGERPYQELGPIESALAEVAGRGASFPVRVGGLGCFPTARRASVLWVGFDDGEGLNGLAAAVKEALGPASEGSEHPFRPHVTLARSPRPVALGLDAAPSLEPAGFEVEGFALIRSRLGGGGPRYEALRRFGFDR